MLTRSEIEQRIINVLQDHFASNSVTTDTRLEDDLNADSLDRLELIMRLEEEFNIEVEDGDDRPVTVGDLANTVEKYLKGS